MTKEDLEKYQGLSAEVNAIEYEIAQLYVPIGSPNGKETMTISNVPSNPTEKNALLIIQKKKELERLKEQLYEHVVYIEDWLLTVEDHEIRSIIRWHYLLGLNWKQTNLKVYGYPDYDYSRKKIDRFFENN